jgi:hypothetical protein
MKCRLLFGLFGRLGDGKTLALTYLTFDHWFRRKEKIFSNYHLFKIPYIYIHGVNQLELIKGSFEKPAWAATDEMWRIIKARTPMLKQNDLVYTILGKSRKRVVTFAFTSQLKRSIDRNVVDVLDFISKPSLTSDEEMCRLDIFAGSKASAATLLNSPRFITAPFKKLYDTLEEIDMENDAGTEMKIIFQPNYNEEHGYCCECEQCGTKFFKTWEEADKAASDWWDNNWKTVFEPEMLEGTVEEEE